jgi:hypothetical protein
VTKEATIQFRERRRSCVAEIDKREQKHDAVSRIAAERLEAWSAAIKVMPLTPATLEKAEKAGKAYAEAEADQHAARWGYLLELRRYFRLMEGREP